MAEPDASFTFIDPPKTDKKPDDGSFTFVTEAEKPKPPEVDTGRDVGRSILAKGVQGLAGVAGGALGSLETFIAKDIPEFARSAGYNLAERMDKVSPAERQRAMENPIYGNQSEMQRKGYSSPITHIPTYKGVQAMVQDVAPKLGAPVLAHEPQTDIGKIAGAAVEGASMGLPGAVRTLPGRTFVGTAANASGEAAGLATKGTEGEPYWRLIGALGGGLASSVASNAVRSTMFNARAKEQLERALADDFSKGHTAMTSEQIQEAIRNGTPATIMDMAGPATKRILDQYSDISNKNRQVSKAYNDFLNERSIESADRLGEHFRGVMGRSIDAPAVQAAEEAIGQQTRNLVYGIARTDPAASAIPTTAFAHLMDRPMFQHAMKEAEKSALNNPNFNIIAPRTTKEVPGTPGRWQQTDKGLVEVPEVPTVPASTTPGNLSYWDQVKRELDNEINKARRSGDNEAISAAMSAKRDLTKELDRLVPSYRTARDTASETFGAATAPQAGYNFATMANEFKLKDLRGALAKFSPEQRELFQVGFMSRINQDIQSGRLGALAKKFGDSTGANRSFQERAREALGDEKFFSVKGQVIAENLMAKTRELQFLRHPSAGVQAGVTGGVAGAGLLGADAIWTLVNGSQMIGQGSNIGLAVAAGATAAGGRLVLSRMERSIAERVLPLATSQKPEDIRRLGELASHYPAVGTVLGKMTSTLSAAITQSERAQEQQARPARASGGKVSIDHEAEADRLIRSIESARVSHSKNTEQLLRQDDSTIATALAIANKQI